MKDKKYRTWKIGMDIGKGEKKIPRMLLYAAKEGEEYFCFVLMVLLLVIKLVK